VTSRLTIGYRKIQRNEELYKCSPVKREIELKGCDERVIEFPLFLVINTYYSYFNKQNKKYS